ncbi:MAG: ABC transporter ATP-binding protein [Thermaerobacter sp.]|nr:ABC transporter ATP-binding protein [Thermaerobacter sp.]
MDKTVTTNPAFSVQNFSVRYPSQRGWVQAVRDVNLSVQPGRLVGLAGESGSGKSTLVLAATRVLRPPQVEVDGQSYISGRPILELHEKELRSMRWSTFSFVTQSAMNALNPVMRLRDQMRDAIRAHDRSYHPRAADLRAREVMDMVELPASKLLSYPHQLSGGQRQRAVIALALLLKPELIVMDEPTTALDVVVQREIIDLIRRLQAEQGFAVVLITHDLSLLLEVAHDVVVLYGGKVMEAGPAEQLVSHPLHPYSQALTQSFPPLHGEVVEQVGIPGSPPDMVRPPEGCPFAPRCKHVMEICRTTMPPLRLVGEVQVACHLMNDGMEEVTTR